MKNTNTNQAIATAAAQAAAAVINAGGTEEQAAAAASSIFAALTNSEAAELAPMASEASKAPAAPKATKAPKAPKPEAPKAGHLDPETWTSYRTADGKPAMSKAKNMPKDARDVNSHENQGQALQRRNQLAKAEAPEAQPEAAPEAPKHEAAPDLDGRGERSDKRNAAIVATIPKARRALVENMLKRAHEAGYRYARLARNKEHQLDGLHMYPGEKGHGRDAAFMALAPKKGTEYRAKADAARADGKPAPKHPTRTWFWSPVGGGNLYIRGIFGDVTEA